MSTHCIACGRQLAVAPGESAPPHAPAEDRGGGDLCAGSREPTVTAEQYEAIERLWGAAVEIAALVERSGGDR